MFTETPTDGFLGKLADAFCKEQKEAVDHRKQVGLDSIWSGNREQYAGIDEQNRGYHSPVDGKAATMDGPIQLASPLRERKGEDRSTVFVNITRPYTNAGTARVADILLPTGKMPWDLEASPVSDLQLLKAALSQLGEKEIKALQPIFAELETLNQKLLMDDEANKASIEAAKKQISDWIKECDWLGQVRLQIIEAGKVGTGVMKGPFPDDREVSRDIQTFIDRLPENLALLRKQLSNQLLTAPKFECIKVENCYPAKGCGKDIQNGKYFFERVPDVSKRRLEEMMQDETYFPEQIAYCLKEGPKDLHGKEKPGNNPSFDLWIRTGCVEIEEADPILQQLVEEDQALVLGNPFLTVTICNRRIIKMSEPMLGKREFPYRFLLWEPREDSWAGIGIPEQIETPQRGLNAAVRALMDNMGYSVGPQVLEVDGLIEPIEGDDRKLRPYKHWKVSSKFPGLGGVQDDPKNAMTFLQFPNYLNEIMPVIELWMKMAEDTTGLPLLLQGQASTDAVGVSQQLMNNASTNLRLIVKAWDDNVCKKNVGDLYEWSQEYGPEAVKGDAVVVPLGSSTLLVKELQMQALMQLGDRVIQPIYGLSPKKWAEMFLAGFQIDYEQLELEEEERRMLEAAAQQPDPKEIVENIRARTDLAIAQLEDATKRLKIQLDASAEGASIAQASDAVNTQVQGSLALEDMRQEGKKDEAMIKASGEVGNAQPTQPKQTKAPELDVDTALNALGL